MKKSWNFHLFSALRESFAEGYSKKELLRDLQAGVVVGVVAIPLGMALAIASGVPPQYGLYTVVVAGFVVALLGGSRFQVTGPTAAFVVLLLPVVQKFGLSGLLVAGFVAGLVQFLLGISGLGRIISFVPHPVTTGFTSGIALVIASLQLKDFFGLSFERPVEGFFDGLSHVARTLPDLQVEEVLTGLSTLTLIVLCVRFLKRTPAPILALGTMSIIAYFVNRYWPDVQIETIFSRFSFERNGSLVHGIPSEAPHWIWPWKAGVQSFEISLNHIREILPSALAIAALGSIESLLSAVVADGMTDKKHDPSAELMALGIGNMVCPFFGGIPATGAIARTTTNIRFGAVSPIASMFHALSVLLAIVFFGGIISFIPMASLAALLLFVAWNMSEKEHFFNILRHANWEDKSVLLLCFGLTVIFDMTVGVGVGVIFACLLFIRRTSTWIQVEALHQPTESGESDSEKLAAQIFYYKISGPLFFGAAHKAVEALMRESNDVKVVILDLSQVNHMDSTGSVALDSTIKKLLKRNLHVYISSHETSIQKMIQNISSVRAHPDRVLGFSDPDEALKRARSQWPNQAASNP